MREEDIPDTFKAFLMLPEELYLRRPNDRGAEQKTLVKKTYSRIEVTDDGLETTIEGEPYKQKGYPEGLHILLLGSLKKVLMVVIRILSRYPWLIPIFLLIRKGLIFEMAKLPNIILRDYYFKPQYYLKSGRELLRIGEKYFSNSETNFNLIMLVVDIWEMDDQYRYRGQFLLGKLKKDNLEHPRKEIKRLLNLMIAAERTEYMKSKWKALRRLVTFLPLGKLPQMLAELDIEKIKLDEADLYFARQKDDFDYD